jgi:uncharacterized membrane protein (DUF106 family)
MKKLIILSLLVFYLPLFQTCSDDNLLNNSFYKPSIFSETIPANQALTDDYKLSFDELTEKKRDAIQKYRDCKKEMTPNSYEVISEFFSDLIWGFFPFVISFFLILISIFVSFTNRSKLMFMLCLTTLILLFTQLGMFYLSKWLEDIDQIKIGYYLLVIIVLLSMIESYRDWKRETPGNSV